MRKLWEAAFNPPPRAADAGDDERFAVLPQNTEDELTLSEVHSKLDRALNFLQRDVGYVLLDDVRPHSGGSVRLRPPVRNVVAVPKGDRSAREPKEPLLRTSSSPHDSPEGLDDSVLKLLHVLFQRSGGRLRASELVEEVNRRQAPNSRLNGQLSRLFSGIHIDPHQEITWEEFQALFAKYIAGNKAAPASGSTAPASKVPSPFKASVDAGEEILSLSPEVSRYAHYQCDLVLVSRFAHVLYKAILQDLLKDAELGLITSVEAKQRCVQAVKHDGVYKCVLQGVRLMHLCDYDYADVVLVLGYATVYFRSTFSSIGKKMSPNEAAHVVVLLIYLAHAFLLDETCPLRIWQKHIFRKYCTLKVLDAALFRLFQMRPGFKLRISDEEERNALLGLSGVSSPLSISEAEKAEATNAMRQMAAGNFTHAKLQENKETLSHVVSASAGHGAPAVPNGRKSANNGMSSGAATGSAVASNTTPGSTSSGSNGRSPPGSGQSADRMGEAPAVRASGSRSSAPAPAVQAGRVNEATNLWAAGRSHRESQRRTDRYAQEATFSTNRADDTSLSLVNHADRPRPAAEVVSN